MKGSPNNSTSPAKKSENAWILWDSSATDLIFDFWVPYAPIYRHRKFERIRKNIFVDEYHHESKFWQLSENSWGSKVGLAKNNELDGLQKIENFQIDV